MPSLSDHDIIEEVIKSIEVEFAPGLNRAIREDEVGIVAHRRRNQAEIRHDVEKDCERVKQKPSASAIYIIPFAKYDERDAETTLNMKRLSNSINLTMREVEWVYDLTQQLKEMGYSIKNLSNVIDHYAKQLSNLTTKFESFHEEANSKNMLFRFFNKTHHWMAKSHVEKTLERMSDKLKQLEVLTGESLNEKATTSINRDL